MNVATAPENTQLVTIPDGKALTVFTTDKAIDPFLAHIREELDAFVSDISTATGRKAVASMAYRVAQSKTYLESVGKALADEQKEIPKKIDACRKRVRDTLDIWRDEVRKPLTDWEAAEDDRVKKHTDALTALNELSRLATGRSSADLRQDLVLVDAVIIGTACEEFEADYARAKDAAKSALRAELARAETREAEQAELVRLREEAAARAIKDREEAIKRQAAEDATKAAERAAQRKIDEQAAATAKAQQESAVAAQRKIDTEIAAANKARDDAVAAVRRAEETEKRLLQEAADKKAAEDAAIAKREANKKHCAAVNNKAVAALVKGGMTEKAAIQAVTLIAKKVIPNIEIYY